MSDKKPSSGGTEVAKPAPPAKDGKKPDPKKKGEKKEETLTEEDLRLKGEIELLAERLADPSAGVVKLALDSLRSQIRTATASLTSIPKPIKFLRPHYAKLKEIYEKTADDANKKALADIISVLGMTLQDSSKRECLNFKLKGNTNEISEWGHEYVRSLAGEISAEYSARQEQKPPQPTADLLALVSLIVPFDMTHNAEPAACDLLMEVEQLEQILNHVDRTNAQRVCLYLLSCATYVAEPDDAVILRIVVRIYRKIGQVANALRVAMRLNDPALMKEIIDSTDDLLVRKQLAFMLARQAHFLDLKDDGVNEVVNNTKLSEYFLMLARELDVMEAKVPEDIYKSHLVETSRGAAAAAANVDSARQNLASTFVNAFVNAGFGQDKLMTEENNKWLYKNKEHGMLSAAASLGMILLWDVEGGLMKIEKFLHSREDYVRAGALLAVGLVSANVKNEADPALALITDEGHLEATSTDNVRICSLLGIANAYAGTAREDILQLLLPIVEDPKSSIEIASYAALALGMVFVGTCNTEITGSVVQLFFERDEAALNSTFARFLCLGLGLLYLGRQETADVTLETLKALEDKPIAKYAALTVETCAYAGTGNVLRVQKMLQVCSEHLEKDNGFQAVAVLGIALISMGEELGSEMTMRMFDRLLQYGEPVIRRAVPLALSLVSLCNPAVAVMDTLSKLSHDGDEEVAQSAILGLGFIGAGTNNARIAGMLRQLSAYYQKSQHTLFVVRLAQGFLHMGKGTMTITPYHADRMLLKHTAAAGLLTVLHACLDLKNLILSKSHYLLFMIAPAMAPRMLMTFDTNLKPLQVTVRVGQAVDTVGQAGRPKTITGFQTHTTPVLLGHGDRAELATDDYLPLTSVLEGCIILRPNPNATPKDQKDTKKDAKKPAPKR